MNEIMVDVVKIIQLRYVDGTALLTLNEKDLQDLLAEVNDRGIPYGIDMNAIKTKTMVISRSKQILKVKMSIEGTPILQVEKIAYLDHIATETGKCDTEIKS